MTETRTFRDHGVEVIRQSLEKMLGLTEAVREGTDIEAVHDIRVASRRLRAAIDVFGAAFAIPEFRRFLADVKAITDELGAARDLDVMIETLEKLANELPEGERDGLERIIDEKRTERRKQQKDVLRALDRTERRDLPHRFEVIVEACMPVEIGAAPVTLLTEGV